jgi:hypothetical protein
MEGKDTTNPLAFSYFEPPITVKDKKPSKIYYVKDVYILIRSDALKRITDKIRAVKTKDEKDKLKREQLPFVTFAGVFSVKNHRNLVSRSQFLALDVDDIPPEQWQHTWNDLQSTLKPALMFRSPKGQGMKIVVCIDPSEDVGKYYEAFSNLLCTEFGISIDPAPKNVSTACFLCYDPEAILDEEPLLWHKKLIESWAPPPSQSSNTRKKHQPTTNKSKDEIFEICRKANEKKVTFINGSRHTFVFQLAGRLHLDGRLSESEALELLGQYQEEGFLLSEIEGIVRNVYAQTATNGSSPINDYPPSGQQTQAGQDIINPYIRVGVDYYKKIHKVDRFGIQRTEIKVWKQSIILLDHGKAFLEKIPKFDDFTIAPNNLNYSQRVDNCYNLYSEFSHKPKPGDWKWTEVLLKHIFGEQYALGIRYFQSLYLHPDHILPILSLVSKERQTGKTTFINWLNMVFGNNVANITPADITGNFNGFYAVSNIIAIEETSVDKAVTIEKLKALATQKFITVDLKFINKSRAPFFGKIILTSNNEDKFVRIDEDEIRFFVRKVEKPKVENHKIEEDMIAEIPAFLYHLTTLPPVDFSKDRTGFTPKELENDSLKMLKRESHSGLYKRLQMHFEELFLNELSGATEFYADPNSIKEKYFVRDNNIDASYIRSVLKNEFNLTPSENSIYFKAFKSGMGKNGRPYLFNRDMFTNEPPGKESPT